MRRIPLAMSVALFACGSPSDEAGQGETVASETHATATATETETETATETETETETETDGETETDTGEPEPQVPGCTTGTLIVGINELTLEHGGLERSYDVHIPSGYTGTEPLPVVFDFHAWETGAWIQELLSGMRGKANQAGFIVVQASGIAGSWNAGPACCEPANQDGVDDVGFFLAMLDELSQSACIDPRRVYVDGMSNGGYLSHRIGCEASDSVAAIGPVASSIGIEDCAPSRALPVLMVSGTLDGFASKQQSFEAWRDFNGCTDEAELSAEHGVFSCWTHDDCDDGVEVTHCVGEGVQHCWPSPSQPVLACSDDYATTDELWAFFDRWSL